MLVVSNRQSALIASAFAAFAFIPTSANSLALNYRIDIGHGSYTQALSRPVTVTRLDEAGNFSIYADIYASINVTYQSDFDGTQYSGRYFGNMIFSGIGHLGTAYRTHNQGYWGSAFIIRDYVNQPATFDYSVTIPVVGYGIPNVFGVNYATGAFISTDYTCTGSPTSCSAHATYFPDDHRAQFFNIDSPGEVFDNGPIQQTSPNDRITKQSTFYLYNLDQSFFTESPAAGQSYRASLGNMMFRTEYIYVPEPSVWTLMFVGFGLLGVSIRRNVLAQKWKFS